MDELLNKCFEVGDLVYIHSGIWKDSFGKIRCFETHFIAVVTKNGLACVRPEEIRHYAKGQEIYPGQFTLAGENNVKNF